MGSSSRFNFTMMGDTVNLGARCESGAKAYGVYTMLSEDTYKNLLITPHPFVFRFVDRIIVKGRKQPVSTYELVGLKNNLPQTILDGLQLFEHGLHFYLARNWDKAVDCFNKSATMELLQPGRDIGVSTNPSLVFLSRCRYFKENPPEENWDGTFIMKTK
jgi:adenylate cyclase